MNGYERVHADLTGGKLPGHKVTLRFRDGTILWSGHSRHVRADGPDLLLGRHRLDPARFTGPVAERQPGYAVTLADGWRLEVEPWVLAAPG